MNLAHTGMGNPTDNEFQANTLFDSLFTPLGGLAHYDSSKFAGLTTNEIVPQDHMGPEACDVRVPTAPSYTGAGPSFGAG